MIAGKETTLEGGGCAVYLVFVSVALFEQHLTCSRWWHIISWQPPPQPQLIMKEGSVGSSLALSFHWICGTHCMLRL